MTVRQNKSNVSRWVYIFLTFVVLGIGAYLSSIYRKEVYTNGEGNFIADAGGKVA